MKVFKPRQFLEKKYEIHADEFMAKGDSKKIFDVGNDIVLKVFYNNNSKDKYLIDNRDANMKLHDAYNKNEFAANIGMHVPKAVDIYSVFDKKSGKYFPALAIKKDKNPLLSKIDGLEKKCAEKLKCEEIQRAKEWGLIVTDAHDNNVSYSSDENAPYFLDFEDWKYSYIN